MGRTMQSQGGRSSFWTPEPPSSQISRLGGPRSPDGLAVSTPPQRKKCQNVEATHGQAAQTAASNSPRPTVVPTFQRLTPDSNLFATGSSPKSSKHVVTSPLHSQHACQLTDDHPKEAKDAILDRNLRPGINIRVSLSSQASEGLLTVNAGKTHWESLRLVSALPALSAGASDGRNSEL